MKIFIRIAVWGYVIAGAVFFLLHFVNLNLPTFFYEPLVMSGMAFISAFLIVFPRLVLKKRDKKNQGREHAMQRFQSVIAFALILNGAGGLGLFELYKLGFQYDKIAHFVVPMLFTVGWVEFFEDWFGFRFRESAFFAAALVVMGGFMWEGLETFSDVFFGTELLGGGSGRILLDTVLDLTMNMLGLLVGLFYLIRRPYKPAVEKGK